MALIHRSVMIFKRFFNPCREKQPKYGTVANKMSENLDNRIVWIDMEMTGLELDTCHIMEVACLVTDSKLKVISDEFSVVINQPDSILANMNEWCINQHQKGGKVDYFKPWAKMASLRFEIVIFHSCLAYTIFNHTFVENSTSRKLKVELSAETGLTDACRNSKISLKSAETDLLKFVKSYVPEKKCPLAGNSIYMDRMFLAKYMPLVDKYLHYRIIDTSSIKECTRRWNYQVYKNAPTKSLKHRAIDDIRESIQELQYYKENVFKITDSL